MRRREAAAAVGRMSEQAASCAGSDAASTVAKRRPQAEGIAKSGSGQGQVEELGAVDGGFVARLVPWVHGR